ncbi:MAG: hypothetical protein GF346_04950, partial [Candidatus Eisenbacteria bacterium]|nr:hypothetical protein [Candidatus Latescibacterota bacterium]MBD3301774.1 hypothetical protein [Candidatus Eisenbacteria bacterium]
MTARGDRPRLRGGSRIVPALIPVLLLLALFAPFVAQAFEQRDPPVAIRRMRPRFVIDTGAFWRNDSSFIAVE